MYKTFQMTFCAFFFLTLVGCQQESSPAGANEPSSAASAAKSAIQAQPGKFITTVPATLSACAPPSAVNVTWNAESTKLVNLEVWVTSGTRGAEPMLFAAGGAKSEAKTGDWVLPGSRFELKDKPTGKTIDETIVGGPNCP